MPKKKKFSVSSNRKYHYRKHKINPKSLQSSKHVNRSPQDVNGTFSVNKHNDKHSITQRNERHSCLSIIHDHCYSMQVQVHATEYDGDQAQTTNMSNERQNNNICQQIVAFDAQPVEEVSTSCQQLKKNVKDLDWGSFRVIDSKDAIRFVELYTSDFTSVKLSIKLRDDSIPRVHVHNKLLPIDHDIWKSVPQTLQSVEQLEGFLRNFSKYEVCTGNFEQEFQDIIPLCSAITHRKPIKSSAFRECDMGASHENVRYTSTIRSVNCKLLCSKLTNYYPPRCKACCIYRCSLRSIKSRRERIKNRKET